MTDPLDDTIRRLDAERNSGPVRSRNSYAQPPIEPDYGWAHLLELRRAVAATEKGAA